MPVAAYGEPNWWLTCILVDPGAFGADREQIRLALEAVDIESRPTWKPLHLQPVFAGAPTVGGSACASVFEHGLCLPTGSALTPDQQARVVETITSLTR
jgi:pyridoxal phosphate-dependent aminotransferase EpsN